MKNILILANGDMAKHFVQWIGKSRIDDNSYYITCSRQHASQSIHKIDNLNFIDVDPTSYLRLKQIMKKRDFSTIFVVMNEKEEAVATLNNIRMIHATTLVVFVSKWEDIEFNDNYISVINLNDILASSLYEKLPNVPIIAKNVGLGRGEIMEILVPFGSSFAYRHVGAISHRKWRIVAIYRNEKQIFPNNATMLLPNDRVIVIGNPLVLEEIYKRINKRQGLFPEPFGKNLYLILNMQQSKEAILLQINEAIFLSNQLPKTKLYIRLFNIHELDILKELRGFETENIKVIITYIEENIFSDIDYDVSRFDIGLFLLTNEQFFSKNYKKHLYGLMRPVYIFGDEPLYNIDESIILMGDKVEMEALSTSAFDFSENLGLELSLCDYNPEGDFNESKEVVEHYETLSRFYNYNVKIIQKRVNPIRELLKHEDILHVAPFTKNINKNPLMNLFSTEVSHYLLSIKKHPQLLIPADK
jgi:hypothetical protein